MTPDYTFLARLKDVYTVEFLSIASLENHLQMVEPIRQDRKYTIAQFRLLRDSATYLLGLLVAPMTITCERAFNPSMSVSSCDTILLSTSPCHHIGHQIDATRILLMLLYIALMF